MCHAVKILPIIEGTFPVHSVQPMSMIRLFGILFLVLFSLGLSLNAQVFWRPVTYAEVAALGGEMRVQPHQGLYYHLDFQALVQTLRGGGEVSLPIPDPQGDIQPFLSRFDAVAEPGYYARHPLTGTYSVRHQRQPGIHGRIDHTLLGFHALIHVNGRRYMIDPVFRGRTDYYAVYYMDEYWEGAPPVAFRCEAHTLAAGEHPAPDPGLYQPGPEADLRQTALTRRDYRLALATTGEYYLANGNSLPAVSAELITSVNRVNSVLIIDVSSKMILVANNDTLIFSNPATDPYSNGNTGAMIGENPPVLNARIGFNNYDIGHVYGTNGGGLAFKPSICADFKGGGVTSAGQLKFDPFYIDYVAHEVGHQYGADHTMNKCDNQNENSSTGWEPGSGSTIMSYSGLCGTNNVTQASGAYYHSGNIQQMRNYLRGFGGTCGNEVLLDNEAPVVSLGYVNGFTIPIGTPFRLRGEASDPDPGDTLSYCWEQMDIGPITDAGSPIQNSPLFRSFLPTDDPERVFPQMSRVLSGQFNKFELLPDYTRDLTFRLTVRDNHPEGGGVAWSEVAFKSDENAGPFLVTTTGLPDTVRQGDYVPVTWAVANTDQAPVNCQSVNIWFSANGGQSFDHLLGEDIPNTGAYGVTMPQITTTSGRFLVEAADNIFFNVSAGNLRVHPPQAPGFTLSARPYRQIRCIPTTAEWTVDLGTLLDFNDPVVLDIESGLPAGATYTFSQNPVVGAGTVVLTVDLSGAQETGRFELVIRGEAAGLPVLTRPVILDLFRAEYSSLNALSPLPGASGVGQSPQMSWVPQADAQAYRMEVATSPAFEATTILALDQLTTTSLILPLVLEDNTLYFWRIIPSNICGAPAEVPVYAFHTQTLSCASVSQTTPITIPPQGTHGIQSVINLGPIGDAGIIRVRNVKGNHQNFGQLRGTLRAPDGKSVRLWNAFNCTFINGNFYFSFNDDSPLPFDCPPDKGKTYKSHEPLNLLAGTPLEGPWTLLVEDVQSGSGGQISEWTLEYCSNASLDPPFLVVKEERVLAPASLALIEAVHLLVQDPDDGPANLTYTLVRAPRKGTLKVDGADLGAGARFSQEAIDQGRLAYQHGSALEEQDFFLFTVEDGRGGWLGIDTFFLRTDGTVGLNDLQARRTPLTVWPNPARDEIRIHLPGVELGMARFALVHASGQVVQVQVSDRQGDLARVTLPGVPSGMYYIQVVAEREVWSAPLHILR